MWLSFLRQLDPALGEAVNFWNLSYGCETTKPVVKTPHKETASPVENIDNEQLLTRGEL